MYGMLNLHFFQETSHSPPIRLKHAAITRLQALSALEENADTHQQYIDILLRHCSVDFLESVLFKHQGDTINYKPGCSITRAGALVLVGYSSGGLDWKIKALHNPFRNAINPMVREELEQLEQLATTTLNCIAPVEAKRVSCNITLDANQLGEAVSTSVLVPRPVTSVNLTDEPVYCQGNVDLRVLTSQGVIPGAAFSDYPNEKPGFLPPGGKLRIIGINRDYRPVRFKKPPLPKENFPIVSLTCQHII